MRRALGKGLSQLITEHYDADPTELNVDAIVPNARQPRSFFDDTALQELAASIREYGVLQPLIVRPSAGDKYELIAGERRLRAAKIVGLKSVPIIIRAPGNQGMLELALIENIQREDINALERARAYRTLIDEFGLTQEAVADKVGKSRTAVANTVRLLRLPARIQEGLESGRITEGHARALLAFDKPDQQLALFDQIVERGLTVREIEKASQPSKVVPFAKPTGPVDPNTEALEHGLSEHFGATVRLTGTGRGGKLTIDYHSEDDLQRILDLLGFSL